MTAARTASKRPTTRQNLTLALLRLRFRLGSWLMPARTLRSAFDLFGTPMAGPRAKAHGMDVAGARIHELPFGDERLTTYVWGEPDTQPRVLLIHGWTSFGLRFLPWVDPLRRAGYAVIAFDQPAHGRSSGCRSSLPMFADGLECVAAHYGAMAGVVGHSLGGAAAAVALSRGLQAERAVLLAPAADPLDAARRFGDFIGLAPRLSQRIFDDYQAQTGLSLADFQAPSIAPRITHPVLVVHDVEDPDVPWAEGECYARDCPQATMISTRGLGHYRIAKDPKVIADAIAFLQGEPVGKQVQPTTGLPASVD